MTHTHTAPSCHKLSQAVLLTKRRVRAGALCPSAESPGMAQRKGASAPTMTPPRPPNKRPQFKGRRYGGGRLNPGLTAWVMWGWGW